MSDNDSKEQFLKYFHAIADVIENPSCRDWRATTTLPLEMDGTVELSIKVKRDEFLKAMRLTEKDLEKGVIDDGPSKGFAFIDGSYGIVEVKDDDGS
jgi:hypothetical protein